MQVVIPMAGFGERFRRAGYDRPKPLIEVLGRPMIAWVLDLFPGVPDPILLCNQDHLDHAGWKLRETLLALRPGARVVGVPAHHRGPVHTLALGRDALDPDDEIVVCVCDLIFHWDFAHFCAWVHASGAEGAVVAYRGFHPHLLHSIHYGFLQAEEGWITAFQEKQAFTTDPIGNAEWCSNGVYWFRSARAMLRRVDQVDPQQAIGGEHYPSQLYPPMIAAHEAVAVYPTAHYGQWGNPTDLAEYVQHAHAFTARVGVRPPAPTLDATLLIPLAGLGERFSREGFTDPKPLVRVNGLPMVVAAARDLPPCTSTVFVLRADQPPAIGLALTNAFPDATQVVLDGPTDGQARTVSLGVALGGVDLSKPLIVGTCDNGVMVDHAQHATWLQQAELIVWTMRGHPGAAQRPEQYGWIDADADGVVRGVSVKRALRDPATDPAIVGVFSFRLASDFVRLADSLFARNGRVNGELYMDSLIEDALALGLRVRVFDVAHYFGWGTPNDWRTYNYWQSYFHGWPGHCYRLEHDPGVPAAALDELAARYTLSPPALPGRG